MTAPARIGQCRACLARPRLLDPDIGVCTGCSSRFTRRWLALCIRARESEEFRTSIRAYLTEPRARKLFDAMFGVPVHEVT